MSEKLGATQNARAASIDGIVAIVGNYIQPVPCKATLRDLLDAANVPRFKANPLAKRGGGKCYYSVPHVEKLFRDRMLRPFGGKV